MLRAVLIVTLSIAGAAHAAAGDDRMHGSLTFNRSLSNTVPLAFGMTADDVASALGAPLRYVRGRPGEKTFLAIRNIGGSLFFPREDRLFLQFRRGRLTGFKGDWGSNWMWR